MGSRHNPSLIPRNPDFERDLFELGQRSLKALNRENSASMKFRWTTVIRRIIESQPEAVAITDIPPFASALYRAQRGSMGLDAFFAWDLQPRVKLHPMAGLLKDERRSRIIEALINRDGDECYFCCRVFEEHPELYRTVDHLVPRSLGGKNHLTNLKLACDRCNNKKGDSVLYTTKGCFSSLYT